MLGVIREQREHPFRLKKGWVRIQLDSDLRCLDSNSDLDSDSDSDSDLRYLDTFLILHTVQ